MIPRSRVGNRSTRLAGLALCLAAVTGCGDDGDRAAAAPATDEPSASPSVGVCDLVPVGAVEQMSGLTGITSSAKAVSETVQIDSCDYEVGGVGLIGVGRIVQEHATDAAKFLDSLVADYDTEAVPDLGDAAYLVHGTTPPGLMIAVESGNGVIGLTLTVVPQTDHSDRIGPDQLVELGRIAVDNS